MRRFRFLLRIELLIFVTAVALAQGDSEQDLALQYRRDLAYRLEQPMINGMDVSEALSFYMKGRALKQSEPHKQLEFYLKGMKALREELKRLPQAEWPKNPSDVRLEFKESFTIPERLYSYMGLPMQPGVECRIVAFQVDGLQQYGVLLAPKEKAKAGHRLIVYVHGAAFGVPDYTLPMMAQMVQKGYVVVAPAFRGEDLLLRGSSVRLDIPKYKCEGEIENLVGEVNDVLAIADGAMALDYVRDDNFAIVGHSFGAGAGLLAAVRSKKVACVVSYDAWLTNPFRFYWERLAHEGRYDDKGYLWRSWPDYLEQPMKDQLAGLMRRSIVHHADKINAPTLLFVGGAYNGSAYHYSHKQLVNAMKKHKKTVAYEIVPGGGHNFVLYTNKQPAKYAQEIQDKWLETYYPSKGDDGT